MDRINARPAVQRGLTILVKGKVQEALEVGFVLRRGATLTSEDLLHCGVASVHRKAVSLSTLLLDASTARRCLWGGTHHGEHSLAFFLQDPKLKQEMID